MGMPLQLSRLIVSALSAILLGPLVVLHFRARHADSEEVVIAMRTSEPNHCAFLQTRNRALLAPLEARGAPAICPPPAKLGWSVRAASHASSRLAKYLGRLP